MERGAHVCRWEYIYKFSSSKEEGDRLRWRRWDKHRFCSSVQNTTALSYWTNVKYLWTLLASPKLLLLGIVKVNFFSALAYSQLYLLSVLCYLYSIYKILGSPWAVLCLILFLFTSFLSHKKEQKGPAPMSQSFLPLARKLLCNITRSVKSCRSLLVAIAWGSLHNSLRSNISPPFPAHCSASLCEPLTVPVVF